MAISTFTPPVDPSPGSTRKPQIRLNIAEFGDGYTQASPKGLNWIKQTIDLTWKGLVPSHKDAIEAFLIAQGGYLPFMYQPYGYATSLRWTCKVWSISSGPPWSITATFEQDFSI